MIQSVPTTPSRVYSIDFIREEVSQLVYSGAVSRQQPIYVLCNYIPVREWNDVECELEHNGFLLRDRIGELVTQHQWEND